MTKQSKLMIFVNILLSLLFVAFNFVYGSLASGGHRALWIPLELAFYNTRAAATIGDFGAAYPNFAFYLFWILRTVNVYFILRLQRSNETKIKF